MQLRSAWLASEENNTRRRKHEGGGKEEARKTRRCVWKPHGPGGHLYKPHTASKEGRREGERNLGPKLGRS